MYNEQQAAAIHVDVQLTHGFTGAILMATEIRIDKKSAQLFIAISMLLSPVDLCRRVSAAAHRIIGLRKPICVNRELGFVGKERPIHGLTVLRLLGKTVCELIV
jgi:hypothetical protein